MSTSVVVSPSAAQVETLARFGITTNFATRSEASAAITKAIADRDMRGATAKQVARLNGLGGRDLPGAGVREISTAIYLMEAVVLIDSTDDLVAKSEYLDILVDRCRERFTKAVKVVVDQSVTVPDPVPAPF
jgi:hypothetical protein